MPAYAMIPVQQQEMMMYTMKDGLNQVWQAIGQDILDSWDNDLPRGQNEGVTLTGDDVASVVYDYVHTYLPEELLPEWKAANSAQKQQWMAEAFPKKSLYGY